MHSFLKLILGLAFISLLSLPARSFNASAAQECILVLSNCASEYLSLANCSAPFEQCVKENAFLNLNKSQECFISDAAWENLNISVGFATCAFVFSNLLWPAMLKGCARWVNKIAHYDPEEHKCLSWLGKKILIITDADGDGKVTASELVTPQTIFAFTSVVLPVYQWLSANSAQALCDYQNSL